MLLSSVIIIDHFLFKESQILNFGGYNFYNFSIDLEKKQISISTQKNHNYIPEFWNSSIQNISAIVGSNGSGKTNILKVLNKSFRDSTKSIFIYEKVLDGGEIQIGVHNKTAKLDNDGKIIEQEFEISFSDQQRIEKIKSETIVSLYYSAIYDTIIPDFHSLLNLESGDINKNLSAVHADTILKQVSFLNNPVSKIIKQSFPDFPNYKSFSVSAKSLSKRNFTQVYSDSNIGNPEKIQTLKISLESDIEQAQLGDPKKLLKHYLSIISDDNMFDILQQIWNLPQYQVETEEKSHNIHGASNFIKDIEITILSFLILNDTYIITGENGRFDFDKVLRSTNFEDFLNNFLKKYIISNDRFFEGFEKDINLDNSQILIDVLTDYYEERKTVNGINTFLLKEKMQRDIKGLNDILSFYNLLKELQSDEKLKTLEFNIESTEVIENTNSFFTHYGKVVDYFRNIQGINPDFLDVRTSVNLSYGEKCLLNLYSTLFNFTLSKNHLRKKENYLVILDEADLGYHPMWKRKYVDSLNKIIPIIFSGMTPMVFKDNYWSPHPQLSIPNIQIIFTTHDPISLSDVPNNSVIYLKKKDGLTTVLGFDDIQRPVMTFGANISNLMTDSFFIADGLIGDFAKEKIEMVIKSLNNLIVNKNNNEDFSISFEEKNTIYKTINIVDEPIIKNKLIEMYNFVFDIEIENEIKELESRIKYLMTIKNNRND